MRTATMVAAVLAAMTWSSSPALAAGAKSPGAAAPAQPRGPTPSEIQKSFDAADLDHDGFISLEEFHKNALQAFNALDANHDGFISREELAPLPRALRQSLLGSLRHADADGDLRLSFKEVMEARMADFTAADTDGDGRLSLREVLDFHSKRPRTP